MSASSAEARIGERRATANALTGLAVFGWPILLAIVVNPLLIRGLGPEVYGLRALVLSIAAYFALMDLGINVAVTKHLAEYQAGGHPGQAQRLLETTMVFFAAVGVMGCVAIWALAPWLTETVFRAPPSLVDEGVWGMRLVGAIFVVNALTWWATSVLAGLHRYDIGNIAQVVGGTVGGVGSVALVAQGYGLVPVVAALGAGSVVTLGWLLIAVRAIAPPFRLRAQLDRAVLGRLFRFGSAVMIQRVAALLFVQVDRALVGNWFGLVAVTLYVAPVTLAMYVHQACARVFPLVFPMVSGLAAQSATAAIGQVFLRSVRLNIVVASAIALPLIVFAEPILTDWLGPAFAGESARTMQLVALYWWAHGASVAAGQVASGLGRPQLEMWFVIASGVAQFVGFLTLGRQFGIVGFGAAMVIAGVFIIPVFFVAAARLARVSWWELARAIVGPVAVFLVMALPTLVFPATHVALWATLVGMAAIAVGYLMVCWVFGVIEPDEKQVVGRMAIQLTQRLSGRG